MTNTEILAIVLVLTAWWIYYHQNNQPAPIQHSNQEAQDLQQQVQHYQNLYQKRVQKDITADQSAKISQLTQTIQTLENNLAGANQAKGLYSQKIGDLEQQLFSLAHQKIKNQKQAQALLNQLESNWKTDRERIFTEFEKAKDNQVRNLVFLKKELQGKNEKIQGLIKDLDKQRERERERGGEQNHWGIEDIKTISL